MKILNKWMVVIGIAAAVAFSGAAQAAHGTMKLIEGETTLIMARASYCISKGTVQAIIDELHANGRQASIDMFNGYLAIGECVNMAGVTITVVDLIAQSKGSGAVEVEIKLNDGTTKTAYLLISNLNYVEAPGDPV